MADSRDAPPKKNFLIRWSRALGDAIAGTPAFLKYYRLAILGAAIYVFTFPNFLWTKTTLWPLAFIALAPMLAMADRAQTAKAAFKVGLVSGFFANLGKLYWLLHTIHHYGHFPLPAAILVLALLCLTIGSFWGVAFWANWSMSKRGGFSIWITFPLAWMLLEWWMTVAMGIGFPWLAIGHALIGWLPLAQIADVIGGMSLSLPVAFGNVVAYEAWRAARAERPNYPVKQAAGLFAVLLVFLVYGLVRMGQIDKQMEAGETIKVGMLQGNIDQNEKWSEGNRVKTLRIYRRQAEEVKEKGAELILMPETALPFWQTQGKRLSRPVRAFLSKIDRWMLVAVPTRVPNEDDPEWPYKYNSAGLVSPDGKIVTWYNKHRLVPFGEYLPFKKIAIPLVTWLKTFEPLEDLRFSAGFYPGEEYVVFDYPRGRFGIAICYEVIYPSIVRTVALPGVAFMTTITNDAWFGDTSAPHQHWDQVRMRAIELRRYFARSANTGISGIIDANGRTISQTGTYVAKTAVGDVRTMQTQSIFLRFGEWFLHLCVLACFGLLLATYRRHRRRGA